MSLTPGKKKDEQENEAFAYEKVPEKASDSDREGTSAEKVPEKAGSVNGPDPLGAPIVTSYQTELAVPGEGVHLEWKNLNYKIQVGEETEKTVLNNISGKVKPGRLVAIMGPSGAGKSSLLNCLAGRLSYASNSKLTGEILVNGRPLQMKMEDISAYVMQEESMFVFNTVEETLEFRKNLEEHMFASEEEAQAAVDRALDNLALQHIKDTIIGNTTQRGVSGGEKKRVNIALDIFNDPPLLFLDEPTTGLDSFQAQNVMEILHQLAQKGRTVIASIHQPRSSIFPLLDDVILLSQGSCIYAGPAGDTVLKYFGEMGYENPANFNPSDYFLDLISVDLRTPELEKSSKDRHERMRNAYITHYENQSSIIEHDLKELKHVESIRTQAGFFKSFWLLCKRSWLDRIRDKEIMAQKMTMPIIFGAIFGAIYWQMPFTYDSIGDRIGILFFMAMVNAFGSTISTATVIPAQLAVVSRERKAGLYSLLAYHLSVVAVAIPYDILLNLTNPLIVLAMSNLRHGWDHWMIFTISIMLESFVSVSFGFLLSTWLPTPGSAAEIAPLWVIVFLMFSGYFLNEANIPGWLSWLKYISFVRYTFQALCVNEFKDACFEDNCEAGNQVLRDLDFEDVEIAQNLIYLALFVIVFNVIGYLILAYRGQKYMEIEKADEHSEEEAQNSWFSGYVPVGTFCSPQEPTHETLLGN